MLDPLANEFLAVLHRFKRIDTSLPPEVGLSSGEMALMHRLMAQNGSLPADLSRVPHEMHISRSAVSQMLNSMEGKHYIRRTINPNDRRRIAVEITQEGHEAIEHTHAYFDRMLSEVIARFGEDDVHQLIALLGRLADVYEEITREHHTKQQ